MSLTTAAPSTPQRSVPPMGGFNATLLFLELRRMLRNRRTVIFSLVMPVAFYFMFGIGPEVLRT